MLDDLAGLSKLLELGALGLINFVLIFKGIGRMQELTDSVKELTTLIKETKIQFNAIDNKFAVLEMRITELENFIHNELNQIRIRFDISNGKKRD